VDYFSTTSKKNLVGLVLSFSPALLAAASFSQGLLLPMRQPQLPLQRILPIQTFSTDCFSQENRLLLETFFPDDSSAIKIDRFGSFLGKCPNDILIPLALGHGPSVWNPLRVVNKNLSVLFSSHYPQRCLMPFIHYLGHSKDKKTLIIQKLYRMEALCAWDNKYLNDDVKNRHDILFQVAGHLFWLYLILDGYSGYFNLKAYNE
jgi:hypothetical protein